MNSKLIIGLVFIVLIVVGIVLYTSLKPGEKVAPKTITYATEASRGLGQEEPIPIAECPDKAKFVIEQKGLTDIHLCQQEEQTIDGKIVWFVKIAYGPGADCPAGCYYAMFQGIVDDTEIIHELGFAPSINSSTFIHEVCGSETKIVKYKDTYKWAAFFDGSPGGKAVYLKNETLTDPRYEQAYQGWGTTELTINEYTNPKLCTDNNCSYPSYEYMDFDDFMKIKGNKLFNNLGINVSHLYGYNKRLISCLENKVVADIEILDNKDFCDHKFNLYLDESNDKYLGCVPEKMVFAQISTDKTEASVNEEIQLTITAFPSKIEVCDPYLTIFYELTLESKEPVIRTSQRFNDPEQNYYTDYDGNKVYIGQGVNVLEPEQFSIGCKNDVEFRLTKTMKFENKGKYKIYTNINKFGTQNFVTVMIK